MLIIMGIACALLDKVCWVKLCFSQFELYFFFACVALYGLPVSKGDLNKGVFFFFFGTLNDIVALPFYC